MSHCLISNMHSNVIILASCWKWSHIHKLVFASFKTFLHIRKAFKTTLWRNFWTKHIFIFAVSFFNHTVHIWLLIDILLNNLKLFIFFITYFLLTFNLLRSNNRFWLLVNKFMLNRSLCRLLAISFKQIK